MTNTHYLELPLSRTYFHGSRGVQAIEIRLYMAGLPRSGKIIAAVRATGIKDKSYSGYILFVFTTQVLN